MYDHIFYGYRMRILAADCNSSAQALMVLLQSRIFFRVSGSVSIVHKFMILHQPGCV